MWWSGACQGDSVRLAGASFCLTSRSSMIALASLPLGHTVIDRHVHSHKENDRYVIKSAGLGQTYIRHKKSHQFLDVL